MLGKGIQSDFYTLFAEEQLNVMKYCINAETLT